MEALKVLFLVLTLTCLVSAFHPRFHHSPHHERASHQKRKSSARQNAQTEVVQTRTGPVAGVQLETENKTKNYTAFSGIPYAKPPIGDLRFRSPQRPDNWTDIYNATYDRNICTQSIGNNVTDDEDCLYIKVYTPQNAQTEVVQTRTGPVAAAQLETENKKKNYTAFSGIPYAKPPIGDLRFRSPQRPDNWTDIYNATHDRNICTQSIGNYVTGHEDCLYINVYTPQLPTNGSRLLPVIIYHGGAWIYSYGNYDTYGPDYLIDEDVVVVTFNFRLGIFGFLYTGDDAAPGNNGLLDQLEALLWVRNNIDAFGGDPDQITLYGQSSGGSSIAYILHWNLKGMVKGAILHSGTSLTIWALSRLAEQGAFNTAADFNISTDNTTELVESLRQIDFRTLQTISTAVENDLIDVNPLNGFVYGPVRDYRIVPYSNEQLINGSYTHIPMLIGYNSDEANRIKQANSTIDTNAAILVLADLHITSDTIRNEVGQLIKLHYFGPSTIYSERQIFKYLNHDQFLRGVRKYAQLVMDDERTYFYRFSYMGRSAGARLCDRQGYTIPIGAIVHELCQNPVRNPKPKRSPLLQYLIWPLANTSSAIRYLDINYMLTIKSDPEGKDMEFWDGIYLKYGVRPFDTY